MHVRLFDRSPTLVFEGDITIGRKKPDVVMWNSRAFTPAATEGDFSEVTVYVVSPPATP